MFSPASRRALVEPRTVEKMTLAARSGFRSRADGPVGDAPVQAGFHFVDNLGADGQDFRVVRRDRVGQEGRTAQQGEKTGLSGMVEALRMHLATLR